MLLLLFQPLLHGNNFTSSSCLLPASVVFILQRKLRGSKGKRYFWLTPSSSLIGGFAKLLCRALLWLCSLQRSLSSVVELVSMADTVGIRHTVYCGRRF